MKKITLIPILALLLTACKKDLQVVNITDSEFIKTNEIQVSAEEELTLNGDVVSGDVTEYGFVITTGGQSPFVGSAQKFATQTSPAPNFHRGAFTAKYMAFYPDAIYSVRAYGIINGQVYYGKTVRYTSAARGSWKRLNNFPGGHRSYAVSFAINGKGYIVGGAGNGGYMKDVWEYDPATDVWTPIGDYPGEPMHSGFSFVIGNKAYVGGGGGYGSPPYNTYLAYRSFYEFDPVTKNWTVLEDVPLSIPPNSDGLFGSFAFSVGGYGFVGGGSRNLQQRNHGVFKFDPATKTWEGYSGGPTNFQNHAIYVHYGSAFVLGEVAYVAAGFAESDFDDKPNNFFAWNYQTKVWTNMSPAPGPGVALSVATTNSGFGYFGSGDPSNDLYQFNPSSTTYAWKQATKNPDYFGTKGGVCFTIGNKTYIGLGDPMLPSLHEPDRMYEFTHTR